jgi:hypothetical protein
MSSGNRINKIATSLWTGVSPSSTAADVAAPILDGVKVIVSASLCVPRERAQTDAHWAQRAAHKDVCTLTACCYAPGAGLHALLERMSVSLHRQCSSYVAR